MRFIWLLLKWLGLNVATQRISLAGSLTSRVASGAVPSGKDQVFINCFPVVTKNAITNKGEVALVKRAGINYTAVAIASSSYTNSGTGWCVWSGGNQRAIIGMKNTGAKSPTVWDETGTQVGGFLIGGGGALTNDVVTSITETLISNVPTLVALVTKFPTTGNILEGFWYNATTAVWTLINDADFPPNQATALRIVGDPVHLDGYMFVMDINGRIWNSDLNSVVNWTSTSFIDASASPDRGVGLAMSGQYIAAFSEKSIQFFQNAGNATGSPLTRVPKTINIGAVLTTGTKTIQKIGDIVYFIGYNKEDNSAGIYRLVDTNIEKISNQAIDDLLNVSGGPNYPNISGSLVLNSMNHVMFSFSSTNSPNGNLMYCTNTGVWWFMKHRSTSNAITTAWQGNLVIGRFLYTATTGYQDDSSTSANVQMTARTGPIDFGTDNLKEFVSFRLIADTQTTSGNLEVSYSDNDYSSFSTAKNIDMTQQQKKLDAGLGWGRQRAWQLYEDVNRPFRARYIDIEYEVAEE